jgi:hypothetical protein
VTLTIIVVAEAPPETVSKVDAFGDKVKASSVFAVEIRLL